LVVQLFLFNQSSTIFRCQFSTTCFFSTSFGGQMSAHRRASSTPVVDALHLTDTLPVAREYLTWSGNNVTWIPRLSAIRHSSLISRLGFSFMA
jgi:hypothetical protein